MGQGAAILGCGGLRLTAEERRFFAETQPWGFILFSRNLAEAEQIAALTDELRSAVGRNAPIFVDQEGGRVARLRAPLAREWLPPLDQAALAGPAARSALWMRYRLIAHELRGFGIDANCAPCADVARPETHPFLRNRCYGHEPDIVAELGRCVAEGLLAGGVLPVLKHIPGHGAAQADSHRELPVVETPDLEHRDFAPFAALSDLPMAMTAHVVYPALDPDRPATLSPSCISAVRERIGFAGLLMTDDISMGALGGPMEARCHAALEAGCDVVLHCNGAMEEMRAVMAAAGEMSTAAQVRADAALLARKAPEPIDRAGLEASLAEIMEHAHG